MLAFRSPFVVRITMLRREALIYNVLVEQASAKDHMAMSWQSINGISILINKFLVLPSDTACNNFLLNIATGKD